MEPGEVHVGVNLGAGKNLLGHQFLLRSICVKPCHFFHPHGRLRKRRPGRSPEWRGGTEEDKGTKKKSEPMGRRQRRRNSSLERRRHRYHRGVVNRRWVTFLIAQVVRDLSIDMQVSVALVTTLLGVNNMHSLPT